MKSLKLMLSVLLLALGGLALLVALNWQLLLSPEQKLRYGMVFSAAEDLRADTLTQQPANRDTGPYIATLVREGNLGRALYLTELYGADTPQLTAIREEVETSIKSSTAGQFHSVSESPAGEALAAEPVFQALLFLDGYRQALLGDWATARNYFAKVTERKLAPELRPYWKYYLARAYRLSGDDKQKAQVEKLLLEVLNGKPGPDLTAKARYNLIAFYLSSAYPAGDGIALAKDQELLLGGSPEGWAVQKAYTDIASYYLDQGQLADAWPRVVAAVMLDNDSESSAAAVKLCLEILQGAANGTLADGKGADGSLKLELTEGLLIEAAQSSINRGDVGKCVAVLQQIAGQVKHRARWEELKVALALCYRKSGDGAALKRLLAEGTLSGFSDAATGRILYQLAALEEDDQEWNAALGHYQSCAKLGGRDAGQAWYGCYHIIKRVQDPLNRQAAAQYLQAAVTAGSVNPSYGKAVEELIPLLILNGDLTPAAVLAERVASAPRPPQATRDELAAHERLQGVGWHWRAYLADRRGDRSSAEAARRNIPCRYWNYYEILNNYPPSPALEKDPRLLDSPENAGEYFAGLGMTASAEEFYQGSGEPGSQVLLFFQLRNRSAAASTLAFAATETLESGLLQEQALLEYVLQLAYPRPFDDDLLPAARRMQIDPALMYGIIKKESAFKARNVSEQGAEGLMQVMPDTASFLNNSYGLGIDLAQRRAPKNNLLLGAANARMLFDQLGAENVRGVIAAHNKGAGNYQKWQRLYPADPVLFTELIPNEENESFSKLVWKYYMIYKWLEDGQQE